MKTSKAERRRKVLESTLEKLFLVLSFATVIIVCLIIFFIFQKGINVFSDYGFWKMVSGTEWKPSQEIYGIFPMILGTFLVTLIAVLVSFPLGIFTAIYLAEFLSERKRRIIKPMIELLAGIPSVIYGLLGLALVNNFVRYIERNFLADFLALEYQVGYSFLSGGLVLAVMILPTIISLSEDAILSVPREYKEGSLALGATKMQTIFNIVLPASKSGIITALLLAVGRAIGETMALIMVIGNMPSLPQGFLGIFSPGTTLTGIIALEMSYAGPKHREVLFALGIILFVLIFLLNLLVFFFRKKEVE